MLRDAILLTLLALDPWHADMETPAAREARMEQNADAITVVVQEYTCTGPEKNEECTPKWLGSPVTLAGALILLGDEESRWALHIQQGRCGKHPKSREGECDGGLAVSPFQLHRNRHMTDDNWARMQSVEGASVATWFAARYLISAYDRCRQWDGAYAGYGTGNPNCDMRRSKQSKKWQKRAKRTREMIDKLRENLVALKKH